jgi:lysophospholipid acyltransferase (LPLAT)-like uncharacterized protein
MARALSGLIGSPAASFGRLASRAVVCRASVAIVPDTPLPQGPTLWISWHECNLIALALHSLVSNRTAVAFVPPGMKRSAMSAWLSGLGVAPVPLAPDTRRGLALRQMEAALGSEKDVLIAVDGPVGPRHGIAPGAMWLARATLPLILLAIGVVLLRWRPRPSPDAHAEAQAMRIRKAA